MHSKKNSPLSEKFTLTKLLAIYGGVFIVWTCIRLFTHASVLLEETLIKGAVFSVPLLLFPVFNKGKAMPLGISGDNFFNSVYAGIILGLVLGLAGQAGNLVRHHSIIFSANSLTSANIGAFLILSLVTAFWEQLLFAGYFLPFTARIFSSELLQVSITGSLFSLIHLPALMLVKNSSFAQIYLSLILLFTLGVSCAILRLRQKNLIAPIMAHALWGVTIFMFRQGEWYENIQIAKLFFYVFGSVGKSYPVFFLHQTITRSSG